jgi:predicted dehydrogenase
MTSKGPVKVALMGAGARGELNLAWLAKRHPDAVRIVAVAEPHEGRRERFIEKYGIPRETAFEDWKELAGKPPLADAVINALPCRLHYESAKASLEAGYHTLLEKPMALDPEQCVMLADLADDADRLLMISLQCRLNKIYTRLKELKDQGSIGDLMAIDCGENIGYWHFVLSYVRGIHYHTDLSHSFIMAKGIHDVDLIQWFAGAPAKRVSSFGSLKFFTEENAPDGAPERCADGCPHEPDCVFSALKLYIKPGQPDIPWSLMTGQSLGAALDVIRNPRFRTLGSIVSQDDLSEQGVSKALQETSYGRCVFRSPNNVVDHQTVSIEFENGVTASYSLNGFSLAWERNLNLHGTKGELRTADFSGRLQLRTYRPARVKNQRIRYHGIIHGGGDEALLLKFANAVCENDKDPMTSARNVLESHLICFAAEEARENDKVVEMDEFRSSIKG